MRRGLVAVAVGVGAVHGVAAWVATGARHVVVAPAAGPVPIDVHLVMPEGARPAGLAPHPSPSLAARRQAVPGQRARHPSPAPGFRLPPDAVVSYRLRTGEHDGTATLRWSGPAAASAPWRLEIEARVADRPDRAWVGTGGLDASGLAPERVVQVDRGRETRAVNFERELGLVGWSSAGGERPLTPGAQAPWTWLLQLASAAEAARPRWHPGTRIDLMVAGLRGELDPWRFEVVETDVPSKGLLHLRRQPGRPYDLQVDAWLDPALHHLPAALALSAPPGRWSFVLQRDPPGADRRDPGWARALPLER